MRQKEKYQNSDSTILYGVPKVEWGTYGGSTPYPICLKACADYLGEDLHYAEILVACGGAFRFTWNEKESGCDDAGTNAKNAENYKLLAELFAKEKSLAEQIWSLLGGWDNMEQRPAKLAEKEVREQARGYIKQIEVLEERCLEVLKKLI